MKDKSTLIFLLIIAVVFVSVLIGLHRHQDVCMLCALKGFSAETVRHYIEGFGSWAIVVYVLLYTLNTFTPFVPPIFIMSLMAGALFGPIIGTLALTLGTLSGTTAAFFTARTIGRGWVENLLKGRGKELDEKLSRNGFFILLPMRLIGFPPYGIIDFVCGLSRMKYLDFITATLIGAAPWIVTQVLLADRFANFNSKDPVMWGLLVAFILMIVITGKIVKKKQAQENQLPA